jgi:hypothetical protein
MSYCCTVGYFIMLGVGMIGIKVIGRTYIMVVVVLDGGQELCGKYDEKGSVEHVTLSEVREKRHVLIVSIPF